MIPVPNAKLALEAWRRMAKANCHPIGVLVYAGGDYEAVAKYMCAQGMETADGLIRPRAGDTCAVIATDVPSDSWCIYACHDNLLWWQWFGKSFARYRAEHSSPHHYPRGDPNDAHAATQVTDEELVDAIEQELLAHPADKNDVPGDGQTKRWGLFQDSDQWEWYFREPFKIAATFRIEPHEVPCLKVKVSFQNEYGQQFALSGLTPEQLTSHFQALILDERFLRVVNGA